MAQKKQLSFDEELETLNDNLEKRFKIICAIITLGFILNFLIFRTKNNFLKINEIIAFAVWGWLLFDFKILQVTKLYLGLVLLGTVIFIYGHLLKNNFSNDKDIPSILMSSTMPIFFLAIQKPLRFIFKLIMKREPKVDKPAPSFVDFVYMLILCMSSLIIPAIYYKI